MAAPTVHVLDYGAGNIRSMVNALQVVGAQVIVINAGDDLHEGIEHLVMPGVGAFGAAMASLGRRGLIAPLRRHIAAGRPMLGVCVGFQVLFESGEELGQHEGLGIFRGTVRRFPAGRIIPHMGWNEVAWRPGAHAVLDGLPSEGHFYFVHSFRPEGVDEGVVAGTSDYGDPFVAAVARDNVLGCQFHPEKSGPMGLQLLRQWVHSAARDPRGAS